MPPVFFFFRAGVPDSKGPNNASLRVDVGDGQQITGGGMNGGPPAAVRSAAAATATILATAARLAVRRGDGRFVGTAARFLGDVGIAGTGALSIDLRLRTLSVPLSFISSSNGVRDMTLPPLASYCLANSCIGTLTEKGLSSWWGKADAYSLAVRAAAEGGVEMAMEEV